MTRAATFIPSKSGSTRNSVLRKADLTGCPGPNRPDSVVPVFPDALSWSASEVLCAGLKVAMTAH